MQDIDRILEQAKTDIPAAADLKALNDLRTFYLGKKSPLNECLKTLGKLSQEDRPQAGQKINTAKATIVDLIEARNTKLQETQLEQQLAAETIDVTLPGRKLGEGSLHPVTQTFAELQKIFTEMGFVFMEGPEIEDDYYNFTALNVPPLHPARAMQDTFYFANGKLLRSQMSPVQIHAMKKLKPPLRMVAMGRVYRRDFDLTHTPMFHQMECLVIDKKVSFANLKDLLHKFLQAFFNKDIKIRLRPSYFPFTEPSAEVDIGCLKCQGKGCRICKNSGWLEVLGCGMVHPNVLREVGIDSEQFSGFAFGVGVDRLAMLKNSISDLRSLFESDLRFLQQF